MMYADALPDAVRVTQYDDAGAELYWERERGLKIAGEGFDVFVYHSDGGATSIHPLSHGWVSIRNDAAPSYSVCPMCSALYTRDYLDCIECRAALRPATAKEVIDFELYA